MGEVGTEFRALQLFETFARMKRPLRLSELAAEMNMPVSSCLALVRRLSAAGHLFEPMEKRAYYPTGKLRRWTNIVADNDPIMHRVSSLFENLRDRCTETVTLSKLSGASIIYLAAVESRHAIRMAARVGALRPAHAVAAGKALLSALTSEERAALLGKEPLQRLTANTHTRLASLEADLQVGEDRGFFTSREESIDGAMAIAMPITMADQDYAIQIAGPTARIEANLHTIIESLKEAVVCLAHPPEG